MRETPGINDARELMDAVRQYPPGGLSTLVTERITPPEPGRGEALVRVHAAAITRDELDWAAERLPAIPSFELSGVVADVGADVEDVGIGDEVYALTDFDRDGAAAEYTVVASRFLAPKPRKLGHVESAAIPLAGLSAWQGLFVHGGLTGGQRVLIHGAAGGVGHLAVQLAHARGAHVIGTASGNVDAVRDLGADEVIDHASVAFDEAVSGVDLVFDTAGGERLARSPAVIRKGGRLVSIASEPPRSPGIASVYFVVEPSREQLVELAALVDEGAVRPSIDEVFPLSDAVKAFDRSLAGRGRGKIVLRIGESR